MTKNQGVKAVQKTAEQRQAHRAYSQWEKQVDRKKALEANYRGRYEWPDEGKYFPHQGPRECARRAGQAR
jgi:hypothetical protein